MQQPQHASEEMKEAAPVLLGRKTLVLGHEEVGQQRTPESRSRKHSDELTSENTARPSNANAFAENCRIKE